MFLLILNNFTTQNGERNGPQNEKWTESKTDIAEERKRLKWMKILTFRVDIHIIFSPRSKDLMKSCSYFTQLHTQWNLVWKYPIFNYSIVSDFSAENIKGMMQHNEMSVGRQKKDKTVLTEKKLQILVFVVLLGKMVNDFCA